MLDPQLLQKLRGANSLSYRVTSSSPLVNLKFSLATTTPARLEPVHRWQRLQWQYPSASGSWPSYSTRPHKQAPVSVSDMTASSRVVLYDGGNLPAPEPRCDCRGFAVPCRSERLA